MIKFHININALITVWLLALFFCLPVSAQVNGPTEKLHWDDIPNWEYSRGQVSKAHIEHSDWDAVTLEPNSSVTYRIPRNAFIRLVSDNKQFPNTISLLRGDGNGLFSPIEKINKIDDSLLIMPENHYWQLLIQNTDDKATTLSVMTSRSTGQKDIPLARELISPEDGQTGWLTTPHLSRRDNYAYTNGISTINYEVEGPLFIEVESLLLETPTEEMLPSYIISSQLNDQPWQQWQHQAARYPFIRRSRDLPSADQDDSIEFKNSTYSEKYYLQIPKGQHTLSFKSLRPIALRLFKDASWGLADNEDFLYPDLKEYQQQQLDYQQGLNDLNNALLSHPTDAAAQLISQWKDQHALLTSLQERAINRLQFYRPLNATEVLRASNKPLHVFNIEPVVAKYTSIQGHPALLDNDHDEKVTKSAFTELEAQQQAVFPLPPLAGPTTLRVRMAGLNNQRATFLLTNQKGESTSIFYYPEFRSNLLDPAVQALHPDEVTTTEAFIPLASTTTTLRVQSLASTSHKLQLAYLAAKKPSLAPEERYQALVQLSKEYPTAITQFLRGHYQAPAHNPSKQASYQLMQLSLAKLAHRVQVRSKQFEQTTPNLDPSILTHAAIPVRWQETVQALVQQQSWAEAIDIVSPLALHKDTKIRNSAAKVLSALLFQSGEFYLYEQWLLKVIKSPAYQDIASDAEQALIARYKQQGRMGALEKLSAYRFSQTANINYLKLMGSSLSNVSSLPLRQTIDATYRALTIKLNSTPLSPSYSHLWQPLQADVVSSDSAILLYGQALESYSNRLTANPQQPLTFTIEGPTRLAVSYRSLLNIDNHQSQDSWLTLIDNQQAHYIPTFSSPQSNEVSIIGSDKKVSIEQRFEYQISKGLHTIELRPEQGNIAIGLSTRSDSVEGFSQKAVNDDQHPTLLSDKDINIRFDINNSVEPVDSTHDIQAILRLIWAVEHAQDSNASPIDTLSLVALGNHLIEQQAKTPFLNRLSQRLNKHTAWRLEQQLVDSAGKRYINFKQAPISNPKTHIRRSLMGQQDSSAQWLSAFSDFNFSIDSTTPVHLRLALRQLSTQTYTEGATIQLWLNQRLHQTINLTPNNPFKPLTLSLEAGNHQLRLAMVNAKSDQHVLFKAYRSTSKDRWAAIEMPVRQAYSVSLKDNPVKVFAAASQWLRIDEIENGHLHRSYHYQKESGILTLLPKVGQTERLLRVYTLQSRPNAFELMASAPPKLQSPAPLPSYKPKTRQWAFNDHLELGEENEGTWGGYLKYSNRASIEDANGDDEGAASSLNAFQVGHLYRIKLNDDRYWTTPMGDWRSDAYWKSDTFLRHTSDSGATLGTEQRYMLADPLTDWRISFRGKAQYFQASNSLTDDVLNLYSDAEYRHDWQFNRQQSLYASLTGFVRYLDNSSPNGADHIDPLVYSDYKRDHLYGWRLAGLWRYRVWQDSRLNIGTRIISNEQLSTLDQMSVQAGYQQYYKGLTAALAFRHVERFSDDDRQKSSQQNEVNGSLRFHQWNAGGNEWYCVLNLNHDFTAKDNALALTFGFNHSDGRGVSDYLPTVLPMRGLYQQQSTQQQQMNTLSDQPSL